MKGTPLWYSITQNKWYTKINKSVKQYPHKWTINNIQVVKPPIENDLIKMSIDGNTDFFVPEILFKGFH